MFAVPNNTIAPVPDVSAQRHPVLTAMSFARRPERWRDLLRYDPVQRFATLIDSDADQEVWLMSWLPGQRTGVHDHGDTSGAFTVVSGTLTEEVLRKRLVDEIQGHSGAEHDLGSGQSRVFAPGYAHRVSNTTAGPAVSIHVYRFGSRTVRSLEP